jgi:uncharacterized membrane protein
MFLKAMSFVSCAAVASLALATGCTGDQAEAGRSEVQNTVSAQAGDKVGAPAVTQCAGTEPFWSLTIAKDKISLEDQSGAGSNLSMANSGAKAAIGRMAEYMALYQGRTLEDSSKFMNVIIKTEKCSDGMSDNEYDHSVLVLSGSSLYSGCCSK